MKNRRVGQFLKLKGLKTVFGGIDFADDPGLCFRLRIIGENKVADADALGKEINKAIGDGDGYAAFDLGIKVEHLFDQCFFNRLYRKTIEGREKCDDARHAHIVERNQNITVEMREKILKRGKRKQPSNQAIRISLAEKYNLKFRRILTITKEFNKKY